MEINKDVAMKLWKDIFGDTLWVTDCFGTWIYRDDYGKTDVVRNNRPGGTGKSYNYGWSVDHIKPVSEFNNENEATFWNNLEPIHISNNSAKGDKLTFNINGVKYQVVKCDICKKNGQNGYGIMNVATNERVDWKYTQNSYYAEK